MQLSYNKLKTFGECARKYRYQYVERRPRAPIRKLALERHIHAALGQYHLFAKRDGMVREEELLAAYARIWEVERNPDVQESKDYLEGETILLRYARIEAKKGRVPAYLEHPVRFAFGPYDLRGRIDRIDFTEGTSYSIIDYKLDRHVPKMNEAERSQQLSFYHLLVTEGLGKEVESVSLYYLRHGVELISERTAHQKKETIDWVDSTAAAIHQEKKWEPQEGPGCLSCAFKTICPEKTGKEHPLAPVWQQGNLLWQAEEEPTAEKPVVSEPAAPRPVRVRQMTLEDFT